MHTKLRREFRVRKVQDILHANFFMFILLIGNHTGSLVQFGINLHLWVFKKRNCTRRSCSCIFSFLKNSLLQINSKLNSKPYDYLYKKCNTQCKVFIILDYDWLKDNRKFSKPMITHKMFSKILCRNFEKKFSNERKMASRKIFWHFLCMNFFML